MSIRLAILLLSFTSPAWAQPGPVPTGVPACDAFVTAYQQCVASPGVPAGARAAIQNGIVDLSKNFRDLAGSNDYARRTIATQCAQAHEATRTSMMAAFQCTFPPPDPALAQIGPTIPLDPPKPAPVRPAPTLTPEQQVTAKANAYVGVQNGIVSSHPMAKDLAEYQRNNERVLRLGTKLGDNAFYQFGIGNFDTTIDRLEAALAMPGTIPTIDQAATALLDAIRTLNPTIKTLNRYQETRAFRDDAYALAQSQHPVFVARMKAANTASDRFAEALSNREIALDQVRLAALPADSLARQLLATSLDLRKTLRRLDELDGSRNVTPFATALADVVTDSQALAISLDALRPKPDAYCTAYARRLDSMIGYGRDIARDIRAGSSPAQAAERFVTYYNDSLRDLANCQERDPRGRQ